MEQGTILDQDEPEILPAECIEIGTQQYGQLNNTQKIFVDAVLEAVDNDNTEQSCFNTDGPGGSGQTFYIYDSFESHSR